MNITNTPANPVTIITGGAYGIGFDIPGGRATY